MHVIFWLENLNGRDLEHSIRMDIEEIGWEAVD
jgi:hypothetical protein